MAQESKTKVVIRKLPPYLKQDGFLEALNKSFEGAYDWVSYYPGKLSHRRLVHSRAYVNFKKPELVYDFHETFDGHVFVNEKGAQFRAEVEYAPYQKIPRGRNKKDLREGTIFEDPDYLAFLADLEKPKASVSAADGQKEEAEKAASRGPIITPLIEFIREKRASKAAGREKVGPRASSRDAARKAAAAALSGVPSGRSAKGAASEKGVLDRKGTAREDSSRKSSSRPDGKARRDSGLASEPDKSEPSSQKPSRSSPRDPRGILKRPPTPESDNGPPSKKDASSRGGPEKRIVKGALASIIGGGLGRPPRGSRDADVRKGSDAESQSRGGAAGPRGGGRQSRKEQRNVPERGALSVEPSGWGDIADEPGERSGGQAADWGTPNPLVASAGNEQATGVVRKDGASRRGGGRARPSGGGPIEGDSQATGWDEASEVLAKRGSPQKRAGSLQEAASLVDGGKLGSAAPQMTILQRNRGGRGSSPTGNNRSTDREGPVHGTEESSVGSIATKLDGLQVGNLADGRSYTSARSRGRGQQVAGNQSPRQGEEGLARGGGRGSRRRGQAQGHAQTHENDTDAAAAAKAPWAAMSGLSPATSAPPTPKPDELTSAREKSASHLQNNDVIRASEAGEAPHGGLSMPQVRIMGGRGAPSFQNASFQNTAFPVPAGQTGGQSAGGSENSQSTEGPVLQSMSGAPGRAQPRSGRQPRHQGPYQPGGRGRGGRVGSQTRQGDASEGPNSAAPGVGSNRGVTESGPEVGKRGEGNAGAAGGVNGPSGVEAAAAKKQMWVAVQKPG